MLRNSEPPAEARKIVERDDSPLGWCNLQDWCELLFSLKKRLHRSRYLPDINGASKWYLDGGKHCLSLIGVRPTRLITGDQSGAQLSPLELPAILVHLDAPDAVIIEQFQAALKEARKHYPAAVVERGRNTHNARFGKKEIDSWCTHKIFQMGGLLAWRAELNDAERKSYPDHVLGAWLGFDAKKTSQAIGCLKRALSDIPALAAQLAYDAEKQKN